MLLTFQVAIRTRPMLPEPRVTGYTAADSGT